MRPKFTLTVADNGWIVRVISSGESLLKEPYEQALIVFNDWEIFNLWLMKFLKGESE